MGYGVFKVSVEITVISQLELMANSILNSGHAQTRHYRVKIWLGGVVSVQQTQ